MKKVFKSAVALLMAIVFLSLSVISAIALSDTVQGKTYSYYARGDCTVDYGDKVWASNNYTYTNWFTVNGNIATCVWGTNSTPAKGTYSNAAKYYLDYNDVRAKAFYWLYLANRTAFASANAKYKSASTTYLQDINNALSDTGASSVPYAFVHCVIDYLQQGSVNPYCDDRWNNVVKAFAAKARYYPNVPSNYKIFYFYPTGNSSQSLMSFEKIAQGYIQLTKRSLLSAWTQGNNNFDITGAVFGVYSNKGCTNLVTRITCSQLITTDTDVVLKTTGQTVKRTFGRGKSGLLNVGTYYIKEITAPKGFAANTTVYSVTVTDGGTATVLTEVSTGTTSGSVPDDLIYTDAKLIKTSTNPSLTNNSSDYSLKGAVYVLYFDSACTRVYKTITTDVNGEAYLSGLVPGRYYVKEKTAPKGFKLNTSVVTVDLKAGSTKTITMQDEPSETPPPPEGSIKLIKQSANPEISADNECYSLEEAVYGIFTDEACTDKVGEIVTDENGEGVSDNLPVGNYYLKELTASEGYLLDVTVYSEQVTDAQITECHVSEIPITQTIDVLLRKQNSSSIATNVNLMGAEYTVGFHAGYFDDEEAVTADCPIRTWVFATEQDGVCKFDSDHFTSGDELFMDDNENAVIPLGTITIQETKAPNGFYLDNTLYIRQMTKDGAEGITQYVIPVSAEFEIPKIRITGEKKWHDDDDRDGKRPESITVELYRDNELIDSVSVSEETDWKYEFADLPKGYADTTLEDHVHYYTYQVKEKESVDGYDSSSTGLAEDPEDENHLICDFMNHHTVERVSVDGVKLWSDFNNVMGYRPESIKVILYRDGEKLKEVETSEEENWSYRFNNLYKYHDGGQEYTYTVGEEPIEGYVVRVSDNNLINTLKTGSITINKTDENGNPMEGVAFKLYTEDNKLVLSEQTDTEYKFTGIADEDSDEAIYLTDSNGRIYVTGLPYGNYHFAEVKTDDGYIPYEEPINVSIDQNDDAAMNPSADVENTKSVMPETGGTGNLPVYLFACVLAVLSITLFIKSKRKDI